MKKSTNNGNKCKRNCLIKPLIKQLHWSYLGKTMAINVLAGTFGGLSGIVFAMSYPFSLCLVLSSGLVVFRAL